MTSHFALHTAQNLTRMFATGALALSLSIATYASAQAAEVDTANTANAAHSVMIETQTTAADEVAQLRHLLSQPHLTLDDQRLLDQTLEDVSEEMADASEPVKQPKSFVETVNDLLGVKQHKTTAQG